MQIDVNLNFSFDAASMALINHIHQGIINMSAQLDALTAQVTQNTTVIQSAMTLITGLKSQLDAAIAAQKAGDDGSALQTLSDSLASSDQALAAAITANTPAAAPAVAAADQPGAGTVAAAPATGI